MVIVPDASAEPAREQLWRLLPLDTPDAQPWTSRQLCAVTGLAWEIVAATIKSLHLAKLIRAVGGSRGRGYLWVRSCETLPPDGRGKHGHHCSGTKHYRKLRGRAARPRQLRVTSNGHTPQRNTFFPASSPLDAWPRLILPPADEK